MTVSVDQDRCCGAGQCVRNAPEVFDQREEDGVVVLLDARPPAELRSAVEDAAASCPSGAVRITEN
ncbi:ferredoxin [Kitasatospora sp. NPDC004614]|uniref:ferredoxin n=1 Tax=unclassified Kitasatospora TaxID=2633591 RepID=UPI003679D4D2